MLSADESEVGGLYMNARADVPIRTTLIEMGHSQPATPLATDNNTAEGILDSTLKQKRSKSIDMRFNWLKDCVKREQFAVNWEPGKYNLADYPTKHHAGNHHRKVRAIYLYIKNKSPKTMQGCIEILDDSDWTDTQQTWTQQRHIIIQTDGNSAHRTQSLK